MKNTSKVSWCLNLTPPVSIQSADEPSGGVPFRKLWRLPVVGYDDDDNVLIHCLYGAGDITDRQRPTATRTPGRVH